MTSILNKVLGQATGADPATLAVRLRPALTYQSNRLYDVWINGRHLIAKEFLKPDEWEVAPAREFGALQRVAHLDIAPQPVFYDPALGPVVVYQFLAGQMWDRQRPSPAQLRQLAGLWTQVQALSTDALWPSRQQPLPELVAWFQESFAAYAGWAAAKFPPARETADTCLSLLKTCKDIVRELEATPAVYRFCRSDARFANVIQRPDGRLGLVDWEDSGLRDPAVDLADLITHVDQEDLLTWDEWQPFLQAYRARQDYDDQALVHRMHLYLGLFSVFWLVLLINPGLHRARTGQLNGWTANGMPATHRLRRYLARALAWPEYDFQQELSDLAAVQFFPGTGVSEVVIR